ncbi:hypothetical protein MYCODSM44623_05780 (plasmid) [Mycobacterium intracellulare subsp. chimaera]|uniref:TnsA endonuclease N-terminal domain-containing protein n=1 Tax=Mycobacterium shimoidei TaxID=29313 RepID=A0A375Z1W3_MYCSH|nr:hypothetical protein MYCODSM44623_00775 [Mycobacterium intracellulare subsp. chimaera]SRX95067.1 hypothetical protein MSP7336_03331 [Mycobacterium shimoidei]ASL08500.1 hypothetical protein MYCODSM44623_01754 [Mycobacterium intracellulare subsp. chimaera]ASL09424.1 hypothetical protein MYCODSM44623_02698 [Mycobacterium intracellulare subsp. chimaera]ASL09966.1 hypothetical protein MYCODSM44623_03255 [Mycobacterium intracellulare subsp. chimaera]
MAPAALWPQVNGGVEVEFNSSGGSSRLPLAECAAVAFELDCSPVRGFPAFRGQGNYPGLWWFSTTREHVGYESWSERDHLIALDADPAVVGVASQPFRLHWGDGRHHVPDYFVRLSDGTATVLDVRADDRISDADAELFDRSEQACRSLGWAYRRAGVADPVVTANLRWLSGYRHPRVYRPAVAAALEAVFDSARPLMTGVRPVGEAIMVLPVLFHLLWHRRLGVDLSAAVLTEESIVGPALSR